MEDTGNFLFLESFFGGSHRDFAEGLIEHSRHRLELVTLPARFWKWRMRGAALYFAHKVSDPRKYDGLVVTDLMSLSDLKALWGAACPPALLYFHENQLTYPLAPGESMDYQFGFTDLTSALAAERILFNSQTHFRGFFALLPRFLRMMPEYVPAWAVPAIRAKAAVLYPGCRFEPAADIPPRGRGQAPLIIWNHRWEFDKNPAAFFSALEALAGRGVEFRLCLLGESHRIVPREFLTARERLGRRVVHYGYVPSKENYLGWLKKGDVVVSTSLQENFGIATVEAIRWGCTPLLPHRLSYPELIPAALHGDFLYHDEDELVGKLERVLRALAAGDEELRKVTRTLALDMNRYAWKNMIPAYDEALEALRRSPRGGFTRRRTPQADGPPGPPAPGPGRCR
jgi:glycosyltransferase involved in cell wall biosynthesis